MGSKDWEVVQEKAFTSWVNSVLGDREKIEDIVTDFSDGTKLIKFLERLSGKKVPSKYETDPKSRIHNIQNHHIALKFLETLDIKALGVGAEDFVDGNKKLILGFLWTLYRTYRIAVISEGDKSSEEGLLLWCKNTTSGYHGVNIHNFKTGFRDGHAFLALAHKYNPEVFDYDVFSNENTESRLEKAFDIAEKTLNIPKLLEVSEVAKGTTDERSLILYTSLFFHAFRAKAQQELLAQSESQAASRLSSLESSLQNEKLSREQLLRQKEELESYKTNLDTQMQAKDKAVGELESRNAALQSQVDELNAKLKDQVTNLEEKISNLEEKVTNLDEKRHHLKSKLKSKSQSLTEQKQTNEEVAEKLAKAEKDYSELQDEKVQLQKQVEVANQEKNQAQQKAEEQIQQQSQQSEEQSKRAESEFNGLLSLRQQLDQHVTDMHRWRKVCDLEDITNFSAQVKPTVLDDLANSGGFGEQLVYLRKKLDDETHDIQRYLDEKEELQKQKMKKPEKK